MEKKELYHLHVLENYDKIWQIDKEIIISKEFKNGMYRRHHDFTTAIPIEGGGEINLYDLILLLQQNSSIDLETLNDIISNSYQIAYNASMFKRETALEDYRLMKKTNLPSRLHSVYLTDEKSLPNWIQKLGPNTELFRVEVDGNIFKTSEYLIPNEIYSYEKMYNKARDYWEPNFRRIKDDANEYLVQGKIKILERIATN